MSKVKISDVAIEISEHEQTPSQSKYKRFVGLEHYIPGKAEITNYGSTNKLDSAMKIFQCGDILIARRNVYLKRAGVVNFDGLTSGDSIVIRTQNPVIAQLLPFILNTNAFWTYANKFADGTMSKRLSPKTLMNYEFNLPSREEQEQLADVLWAAEKTKEAYEAQIIATDELVKSQFIEVIAPLLEAGHTVPLNDLIADGRPITYGILKPGTNVEGGIPVVKVKDMVRGIIDESDLLHTTKKIDDGYKRSKLNEGDLLISIRGSVGRTAIVPASLQDANITQDTARLSIKPEHSTIYIRGVLESQPLQLDMEHNIRGVAVKGINIGYLRQLGVPVADRPAQDRLEALYQQSDKSKFELQQSIERVDNLIKALIQQDDSSSK